MTPIEKIALNLGSIEALGTPIKDAIKWNPAVTSMVLGGGLGALVAGDQRRTLGALAGATGGLGAGLVGAGLKGGLATKGVAPGWLTEYFGQNPQIHQQIAGGIGGLGAGALTAPRPQPLIISTAAEDESSETSRFQDLVDVARQKLMDANPEPRRV